MKFGLSYNTGYYGTAPDQMIAVARHAERCGFESFHVPEHIALYPGATVGPVALGKRLATLDVLSKGRMRLLAVGVGALPGEAMAAGVDFASRGRRADEAIDVLRLLWAGDENGVSFDGEFFSFTSLCSFPKPLNKDGLPIHIGGSSRAAGRDPGALECTRWGSIDMTADDVAGHAANGTTRLVVGPVATDEAAQRDEISAFADRLGLRG